ncbi:MAG: type II secretion system F family protein [Armatimonadetes bacterium]|nr:type II secretion system F family protein [Armatimonadota bacterium]
MKFLWATAAFAAVFAAVLLVGILSSRRQKRVSARLKELTGTAVQTAKPRSSDPIQREDAVPILTRLLKGRRITDRVYSELSAAGLPIRPSEFVGILCGCLIVSQLLAFAANKGIIAHLVFGAVAIGLPIAIVRSLQTKRRAAFDAQIVDALITMSASLKSGFALMRAMQMVAQEMPPPISQEFERVVNEVGNGRGTGDALRASVERVGSYDFDLVVTAILIHQRVGGNLSQILDTIADTIRERAKVMGEMKALTAEGRISGLVLVLLPLVLAVFLFGTRPEYMSPLLTDPLGQMMVGAAASLQIIGVLIMRKMLALDF